MNILRLAQFQLAFSTFRHHINTKRSNLKILLIQLAEAHAKTNFT